jgi:hypothetical protein
MPKGPRGPRIHDEFTDLHVSPQRRSQLRNRRDGKCMVCGGEVIYPHVRCPVHLVLWNEYQLAYHHRRKAANANQLP